MAWHICLFGSLHFAFIMPPLPAVFLSFSLTTSLYSVTFRPYYHDLISTGHLPPHPTPSQKNVQGSMRLITFILWNLLIIQAQMTRDSLVQQFHTRRDCSLQLAAAAPGPQPEWELAEAAGGGAGHNNAVVLLLPLPFSFTAILSTRFHLWFKLHGHTVGGSDEMCMGFSLGLSLRWGVSRIFYFSFSLCCDQALTRISWVFYEGDTRNNLLDFCRELQNNLKKK